jgi:Skp family chaperone for outer membrane proteins
MAQDKLEELKNILLGDELRRFDTKFMEFGDKLQRLSENAGSGEVEKVKQTLDEQLAQVEEKIGKMQKDVKAGFDKIIDTINVQFKKMDGEIQKNARDMESMRKKFDGFKQLFSDK